jgi:hypothetical protein
MLCNPGSREAQLLATWRAVCWVESRGDPYVRAGDGGRAVGIAQIHRVLVDDVNRIAGRPVWTYADRQDPVRAYAMFRTYALHYWPQGGPEQWARGWNGGPRGPQRAATRGYWQKVRAALGPQP